MRHAALRAHNDPAPRAPQTIWAGGLPLTGASSSQTAGNPACPAGYAVIDVDLNRGAGGAYSYLCVQRGDGGAGGLLLNLSVAIGSTSAPPVCPSGGGWQQVPGNLKEGTASAQVQNLCVRVAVPADGALVVTDVAVAQEAPCAAGYAAVTPDISGGVGVEERVCARFEAWSPAVAARWRRTGTPGVGPAGAGGGAGAALPRLPATFAWSTDRPADKAPRAAPPPRRKPLGVGLRAVQAAPQPLAEAARSATGAE